MKGRIIEQVGPTGSMEVVDGEFRWAYNGDEPIVESTLQRADEHTQVYYDGEVELKGGQTAPEMRREAPAELKYMYAKTELRGIGEVWDVIEVDPDHDP